MFLRSSSKRTARGYPARGTRINRRPIALQVEYLESRRLLTGNDWDAANLLTAPTVVLETNHGDIALELLTMQTPGTVDNFLNYANGGDYDNSFFHRLVPGFVIQGGGYATTQDLYSSLDQISIIPTDPPVANEFGVSNTRATVAMAKQDGDPDSATSQFFVNLTDNSQNLDNQNGGFTVFGTINDMTVIDEMATSPVQNLDSLFNEIPIDTSGNLLVIHSISGDGEIRGEVFEDLNQDGVQDYGESGISGVTLYVDANDNGDLDGGELTTTSSNDGSYVFQVPSGDYVIRQVLSSEMDAISGDGRAEVNVEMGRYTESVEFGQFLLQSQETQEDLVIIDDADEGFTQFGFEFIANPNVPGYQGSWYRKQVGTGEGEASWTFTGLAPGEYRVSKTWREHGEILRAKDAPITILNGTGEILSEVVLNQRLVPDDFTFDGAAWEDLGVVTITDGVLVVTLMGSLEETGEVIADAVCIVPEQILTLSMEPGVVGEADGAAAALGTVTRSRNLSEDLLVTLASDNPTAVSVPASVVIPAGQASTSFAIDAIDNLVPVDSQSVIISANAHRATSGEALLELVNDDLPVLDVETAVLLYDDFGEELVNGYLPADAIVVYEVTATNHGNLSLENVIVVDDNGTPDDSLDDVYVTAVLLGDAIAGDTDQNNIMDPGESWLFATSRTALAGAHANSFTFSASEPLTGSALSDAVSGTYFGVAAEMVLSHSITGSDYDSEGGALAAVGDEVLVSYSVHNSGNVALESITFSGGTYYAGDTDQDDLLDTDEVWEFVASHVAEAGSQQVGGSVSASGPLAGSALSDAVSGTYFGVAAEMVVEAYVVGAYGDLLQDPILSVGDEVQFLFRVLNTGNADLTNLVASGAIPLLDGEWNVGDLDCDGLLDTDEVWKFEASGAIVPGEQVDQITVVATVAIVSQAVEATTQSRYFGEYRPLVVTHTGDLGIGSLRYVIEDALSRPQGGNITFDISETDSNFIDIDANLPSGDADPDIFLIQPLSPLPALDGTAGIWIDGGIYGESESNVDDDFPRIVIDGSLAGISNGLQILSDNNGIRGLGIQNFQGAGIHAVGSGNTIVANNIGVDIFGGDGGNGSDGIWIESGSDNMIGGLDEGSKNVIAFNHGSGVSVAAGTGNQIIGNEFFKNLGLGIDLGRDGFTANDMDLGFVDVDNGANDLLNTPVITRIEIVGDNVEVDYSVPTNAEMVGDSLRIEFFLADESRREGAIFVGSDEYTYEDFLQGGKTLQAHADDLPSWDVRVVATAISAQGGTSEFSTPRGIRFAGRSAEAEQQDAVDNMADGILGRLEALFSQTSILPPAWAPELPMDSLLVANPMIDKIYIGRGAAAEDETDRAIDLGRNENALVTVGFGEEVDEITMAVNDFCVEQVMDLVDTLSLSPGEIIAAIWFDPINFSVSIDGHQVSYDYDNNPSQIVGNIPGASLVVTPQSPSTPGGVQGIMFTGNPSTIDLQMSTTSSGEMMRGGVNIYTVGSSGGGITVQPSIRTVFQGNLPRDSIVMTFDPSAPASLTARAGGATTLSMMGLSTASRAGGGGAGGGLPVSIAGIFAGPSAFDLAFLDPVSLAESVLDISGTTVEDEDQEGEVENLQNQVQDEYGNDLDGRDDEEEFSEEDEERNDDDEDDFDDQDDDQSEDEEDIEETISVIFNLIGESLASDSGRVNVIEILEGDSGSSNQQQTQDARERDQYWETSSTEFSAISIDRSGVAAMAGVEPAGPRRFLDT